MQKLTATEKILLDPGFRQAYSPPTDEPPAIRVEQSRLAPLKRRQRIKPRAVLVRKVPPPPMGMTETELLRTLQKHGIGRPATYAGIVETLLRRKYVTLAKDGRLQVTERGIRVYQFLEKEYPQIANPVFTNQVETALDAIARGERSYRAVLTAFWGEMQKGEWR